jgi:hypothetical protein
MSGDTQSISLNGLVRSLTRKDPSAATFPPEVRSYFHILEAQVCPEVPRLRIRTRKRGHLSVPPLALSGRRGSIGSRAMPSRHRLPNGHLSRVAGASVRSRRIRTEILRPFRQSAWVSGSIRFSETQWLLEICFRGDPPVCQGARNE